VFCKRHNERLGERLFRMSVVVHCASMYTAVYEKVSEGYVAWLEEIPGVLTQGRTKRETQENLKDAFKEFILAQRMKTRRETKRRAVTRERFVISG